MSMPGTQTLRLQRTTQPKKNVAPRMARHDGLLQDQTRRQAPLLTLYSDRLIKHLE